MEKQTRVVVYGSSLSMAGIAASLKAEAGLEVICAGPDWPDGGEASGEANGRALPKNERELAERKPDVILLDIQAIQPVLRRVLELELRGLRLIVLDSGSKSFLVLTAYPAQALSAAELVEVILQDNSPLKPSRVEPVKRTDQDDFRRSSPGKEAH